jgi:hypothetical protein
MRVYTEMIQKSPDKVWIYLDDVRVPTERGWTLVKNYEEFVETITRIGLENIELISLDHDLGETAMREYFNNVHTNIKLNYKNSFMSKSTLYTDTSPVGQLKYPQY